jgi:hypothetical protein
MKVGVQVRGVFEALLCSAGATGPWLAFAKQRRANTRLAILDGASFRHLPAFQFLNCSLATGTPGSGFAIFEIAITAKEYLVS